MNIGLQNAVLVSSCAALAVCIDVVVATAAQTSQADQLQPTSVANTTNASPIYGIAIPGGYREWQLVAVAHVPDSRPNRLTAILGNPTAIKAFRDGTRPFPDGAMLAKLEWNAEQHPGQSNGVLGEPKTFIPGKPRQVGFMVKGAKRFAATGGWGYGQFVDGKPLDEAKHETCAHCHAAGATSKQDFVFTHYAK